MRVVDLLALLQDQPINKPVQVEGSNGTIVNFDHLVLAVEHEQPQALVYLNSHQKKPLRVWELRMLLQKMAAPLAFVYVHQDDIVSPLFGFITQDGRLILK